MPIVACIVLLGIFLTMVVMAWIKKMPVALPLVGQGLVIVALLPPAALSWSLRADSQFGVNYKGYYLQSWAGALTWGIILASVIAAFVSFFLGSYWGKSRQSVYEVAVLVGSNRHKIMLILVAIVVAVMFLYLHYRFGFAHVFKPRAFYEQTRVGFGLEFFALGLFVRLGFLLALVLPRRKIGPLLLFFALSLATGSKGVTVSMIVFFFLYMLVTRYRGHVPGGVLLISCLFGAGALYVLFSLTFYVGNVDLYQAALGYLAQPYYNLVSLVEYYNVFFFEHSMGKLVFENNFVARIPRALYPGKPIDFGAFLLSMSLFPQETKLMQGAPSFTVFGHWFADFGWIGMALCSTLQCIKYFFAGYCFHEMNCGRDDRSRFAPFVIMVLLLGFQLLRFPPADSLPENIVVVVVLALIIGVRVEKRVSHVAA